MTVATKSRVPLWTAVALVAIGAIVFGAMQWRARRQRSAIRLAVALPPHYEISRNAEFVAFAISPDGNTIVLAATERGKRFLFLRTLDSADLRKVDGSDGAFAPFWSPDGAWIGFSARGKLWKTKRSGGVPQAVCELPAGAYASWQGDTIVFGDLPGGRNLIHRVDGAGGTPVAVTALNEAEGEGRHMLPRLLPDGRHFLYVASVESSAERRLMLGSLDAPVRKRIATNVSADVPSGISFFMSAKESCSRSRSTWKRD